MRKTLLCMIALLAGCGPGSEEQAGNQPISNQSSSPPPPEQLAIPAPAPGIDPRSPEAAAEILRHYFAAIGERRYADAYRLWSDSGRASGMSQADFAASFDPYRIYRGEVGAPGAMEGAAGSSYLDIPVIVTGRMTNGAPFRQTGTITMRRANDVPGATPDQLQWRIYKSNLQTGEVAASYRFVGRWATDRRNCTANAWVFTVSSLKTSAGSVCSFSRVTEVPGGYDVTASCMAEGPARDDVLQLRFAESARALLFESRTIADAGLVRCR